MPLKFFLKLYARLAGLALLVGLLCVLLFQGVNSVRLQAWQERFPAPLMQWLATVPDPAARYHWLAPIYDFQSHDPATLTLSPVTLERLAYGHVVAQHTSLGLRVLRHDGEDRILSMRFRDLYREVSEATGLLVLNHLNAVLPAERDAAMASLAGSLGGSITAIEDAANLPETAVLDRVLERELAYYRPDHSGPARVLLRLSDGSLVQLRMPADFDPWAWPMTALLLLVIGVVLAVALMLLLRGVHHNLRAVESVAVRIARGEMDARVETSDRTMVSRLAVAFNSMAEHIQRLVGVQSEMIHAVSHELRTPVARIRFGVQMIEDCDDAETLQKQLEGIDGDIQELDELIDEILTYARLEQGGPVFSLQDRSVTEIVRQVVDEQRLIHTKVTIEPEIPEASERWAHADVEPRYLHRAVQNLVGNAARYAASRVRVSCHLDEQTCRIDVEDDGPGIPEQDWEKVFTAFARLDDSRTRTSGGYGLGLSIVRRILYWHGGQAFVNRSDDLGGARFSLVWPRRKPDELDL
ncbi:MAG: ATP-binding protein [Marinobacter sp.]|uniref:ATP-binding protein n=1 Tax=Marinobacter sp. TaxID=50741 RepID=UPI00299E388F|nr:ATP-binding protein [Marinobacter sp.]MDX1633534.1 ATP-binding protein [Marinobacter sp.]